jgi:FAD/FMN-containing dehydrogenase
VNDSPRQEGVETPATEREIASLLQRARERGGPSRPGVGISRERLNALVRLDATSGLVEVGAGIKLERIEREIRVHELTLGPLSPGMATLDVAGFLEGPYAGLRALPGGALESCCIALTAIMPDGLRYVSRPSPRSAAGPDLDALFVGGEGRFGLVTSATLRLFGRPRTERWAVFSFGSAARAVSLVRAAAASGAWIRSAALARRGERVAAGVEVIGSPDAVERDLATLGHEALARGGRPSGREMAGAIPAATAEWELSWEQLAEAVGSGSEVRCWRIAWESVVAVGAGDRGGSLSNRGGWANRETLAAALSAADPEGVLGGAP